MSDQRQDDRVSAWMRSEPTQTAVGAITEAAVTIQKQAGFHALARVSLHPDLGARMDLTPGDTATLTTPAGAVEVYCEAAETLEQRRARHDGSRALDEVGIPHGTPAARMVSLRHALREAQDAGNNPKAARLEMIEQRLTKERWAELELAGPALRDIPPGLYRLHWRKGGFSLAAVGATSDGSRWFAPVEAVTEPSKDWNAVVGAERIEAGPLRGDR